ncbi:hypothetical protein, partial [Bacillus mobilis]
MHVNEIEINSYILDAYKIKEFSWIDNNVTFKKITLKLDYIYAKYYLPTRKLVLETSVVKVINNNINNLIPLLFNVDEFWDNLNSILYKYLQVTIKNDKWVVSRLDITHDIKTKNIEQAVGNLSDLQIKNYNTNLYNKNEG